MRLQATQCVASSTNPLERLVIDEGHVSASPFDYFDIIYQALKHRAQVDSNRTPTTNLLGLSLGKRRNEEAQSQAEDDLDEFVLEYDGTRWKPKFVRNFFPC